MPILTMCANPQCGELFDAPDAADGKRVRCPACGHVQTVHRLTGGKPAADTPETAPQTPAKRPVAVPTPTPKPVAKPPTEQKTPVKMEPAEPLPLAEEPKTPQPVKTTQPAKPQPPQPTDPTAMIDDLLAEEDELVDIELDASDGGDDLPPPLPNAATLDSIAGETGPALDSVPAAPRLEDFGPDLSDIDDHVSVPAQAADASIISRPAAAAALAAALIAAGAGAILSPAIFSLSVASVYIGAMVGWCGGLVAAVTMTIGLADADADLGDAGQTMLGDCFSAWRFPMGRLAGLAVASLVMAALATLADAGLALTTLHASSARPLAIAAAIIVAWLLGSYCLRWLLDATGSTLLRQRGAPNAPTPASIDYLAALAAAPALIALYVVPLVTLPLLPVAILLAGARRWRVALNPAAVARIANRQLTGTMVLHLALLVWLAAGLLAAALLVFIRQMIIGGADLELPGELAIRITTTAGVSLVLAAALLAVALIVGRCVGYFGLYHRNALKGG